MNVRQGLMVLFLAVCWGQASGSDWPTPTDTMAVRLLDEAGIYRTDAALPQGKWSRCRVEIDGKKIALWIDGRQTVQKASYVISVVADVEGLADQSGDACSGPDLCSVAMRNRSLEQQFDQPLTLSRVKLGGASWRESYP